MNNPINALVTAARSFYGALTQPEGTVPTRRENWLGPRFEPINISSYATVQSVQTAIRQAETGETTSLFRFYRDCLLGDDHIQGELAKRKLAVIGQPFAVLPADKTNEDDVAAAAACLRAQQDCENWIGGIGSLLSGSQWPVCVAENIFRKADTKPVVFKRAGAADARGSLSLRYTLKQLEPVNPMLFCFRHAYMVGGVGVGTATPVQMAQLQDLKGGPNPDWFAVNLDDWEPFLRLWPIDDQGRIIYDAARASKLDPTRHVVHRGHLLTDQRDNWGGPMRAILFWWLLRGLGRDWFARFMERYGSPFPVGKTNVQDKESVALLEQAFALATKIGGLIIGQDDQVDLQQAMVQGGADGHKIWHDVCNNAISRHITGFGSSEKPAGLNAGEEGLVQGVRADIRIFDGKLLSETLVKQPFANFLRFNGLAGSIRISIGALSPEDAKSFVDLLKTAKEAGWEPTDTALPVIEEKLGIEMRRSAPGGGTEADAPPPDKAIFDPDSDIVTQRALWREKHKSDLSKATDEVETLSAGGERINLSASGMGRLIRLSAGGPGPTDDLIASRVGALAAAYRGSMAPFRQTILASESREGCLKRLELLYADWPPERLAAELEEALQLAAASGAGLAGDAAKAESSA